MDIEIFNNEVDSELMQLLLEADPSTDSINEYISKSIKFVAKENHLIVGILALMVHRKQSEIKNISVKRLSRNKGVGTQLISKAIKYSANIRLKRVIVGTGNSSFDQLRFYQKNGFRIYRIVVDYFDKYDHSIYENKIQCRDLIMLRNELQ